MQRDAAISLTPALYVHMPSLHPTYPLYYTGPYTNVLDLSIFPMMSKRHSERLQMYNNTEALKERVWCTAMLVWNKTSSADIARAFVLAYRVMGQIIAEDGNNQWLAMGTPHCNVRKDFIDTTTGIRRKFPAPDSPAL